MKALLKVLAWIVWCSVVGALMGHFTLQRFVAMGQQEFDMPLMERVVLFRGMVFGCAVGLVLGLCSLIPKKERRPKGLIVESAPSQLADEVVRLPESPE